jgi:hypothetical protein
MSTQVERAIENIQRKNPAPPIDFTQHTLENGDVVSTQERVVKDVSPFLIFSLASFNELSLSHCCPGASTGDVHSKFRTVL